MVGARISEGPGVNSSYEHILFSIDDGVATITLNRPEVLNAFSSQMGNEVQDAFRACDGSDDVRAVVVTGAGRAFCSGADFSGGSAVFGAPSDRTAFNSNPYK
jgi:enoyl-CoA hydratase/carnithine racemase